MEPTTLVVAVLLAMVPDSSYLELVAPPAQMPYNECIEQAAAVNADPTTPYIMLCGPLIKNDGPEIGV